MPEPASPSREKRPLDEELTRRLRERGRRVTAQRLILHRVVREQGGHASAEEVLEAAAERLPHLSLPTVYAALELFEKLGIVRRVALGPGPVRFDARTTEHHHLACRRCGQVVDLEVAVDAAPALAAARAAGLHAERAEVVVQGLCTGCSAELTPARS